MKKYICLVLTILLMFQGCNVYNDVSKTTLTDLIYNGEGLYVYNRTLYIEMSDFIPLTRERSRFIEITDIKELKSHDEELPHEFKCLYSYYDWLILQDTSDKYYILMDFEALYYDHDYFWSGNRAGMGPLGVCYDMSVYRVYKILTSKELDFSIMDEVGVIQNCVGMNRYPQEHLWSNNDIFLGHILYNCGDGLLISCDGGETFYWLRDSTLPLW